VLTWVIRNSNLNFSEQPQEPKLQPAEAPRYVHSNPTPLQPLTNAAALVECLVCGERAMTQTEAVRGTTTRYVFLLNRLPLCIALDGTS
jgi:hypothetical protein